MKRKLILTPADRNLLQALRTDPLASFAQLGEQVNLPAQTVSHRYNVLREEGIVQIFGRTLPSFSGRVSWIVRVQIEPAKSFHVARHLAQNQVTRWVRLSSSHTELMCGVMQGMGQSREVFEYLGANDAVRQMHVHELLKVWTAEGKDAVAYPSIELDDIDHTILRMLGRDGRMSVAEIARESKVNASTISRRRARLIEHGVLYFETDIDHRAMGYATEAMVWMQITPGYIEQAGRLLRQLPQCRFAAAVGGRENLVANLVATTSEELMEMIDEHLREIGVASCEIVPMRSTFKRAL